MSANIYTFEHFSLAVAATNWIGKRDEQEDAYKLTAPVNAHFADQYLAILADGMGGAADGEKASRLLVETMSQQYFTPPQGEDSPTERLKNALLLANRHLGDEKLAGRIAPDAGSTLIGMHFCNNGISWINVGDSLLYRHNDTSIVKINEAHTWEWELQRRISNGTITQEEADATPGARNALFSAVCGEGRIEAVEWHDDVPCEIGTRYIIGSDGLQPLIDTGWEQLLNSPELRTASPDIVCRQLITSLQELENPRQDNTTIIVIDIIPRQKPDDCYTDVSLLGDRSSQQDAEVCLRSDHAILAVVADGAGGHRGGAKAAQTAVSTMVSIWKKELAAGIPAKRAAAILSRGLVTAHENIIREAGGDHKLCGKSAVVVLYLSGGEYTVVNAGDCRAYMGHGSQWNQLSIDDSLLRLLIERGDVSPEEAPTHPDQNILTQALGGASAPEPHIKTGHFSSANSFILCCDGLWNQLPNKLWPSAILPDGSAHTYCHTLSDMAEAAVRQADGKSDNVSAVWVHSIPQTVCGTPLQRLLHPKVLLCCMVIGLGAISALLLNHVRNESEPTGIPAALPPVMTPDQQLPETASLPTSPQMPAANMEQLCQAILELHHVLTDIHPYVVEAANGHIDHGEHASQALLNELYHRLEQPCRLLMDAKQNLSPEQIEQAIRLSLPDPDDALQKRLAYFTQATIAAEDLKTEHFAALIGWQEILQTVLNQRQRNHAQDIIKQYAEQLQQILTPIPDAELTEEPPYTPVML